MATNEVFKYSDWITLPVGTGVKSGDPVVVGQITGVAQTDADDDGNASVALTGAFNLNVDAAVNAGDPIYVAAGAATATATGNQLLGMALATTSAAGNAPVRLTGFSPGAGA